MGATEPKLPDHSDESVPGLDRIEELDPARREEVRRWLSEPLDDCAACGHPVYRASRRAFDAMTDQLGHRDCMLTPIATCPFCDKPIDRLQRRAELDGRLAHQPCASKEAERRQAS